MDFNKLLQSKVFRIIFIVIGALIILLFAFKVGVFVGYRKAQFSYRWGENYHRNFAGPRGGFFSDIRRGFSDKDFIDSHGIFGSVIKVDGNIIIVKGKDDIEKTILVSDETAIRKGREEFNALDLKIDEQIVVIGSPNDEGQIEAKLIRIFSEDGMKLPTKSRFNRFF